MIFTGDFFQLQNGTSVLGNPFEKLSQANPNTQTAITKGRNLCRQVNHVVFLDAPNRANEPRFSLLKRR